MGLDFIRRAGGNFRKSWSNGAQQLASQDLFTSNPECTTRMILADLIDGQTTSPAIKPSEKLILQCEGGGIVVYRDIEQVAKNPQPPSDVVKALIECGGYALVEVEKVNERSRTISLSIKE